MKNRLIYIYIYSYTRLSAVFKQLLNHHWLLPSRVFAPATPSSCDTKTLPAQCAYDQMARNHHSTPGGWHTPMTPQRKHIANYSHCMSLLGANQNKSTADSMRQLKQLYIYILCISLLHPLYFLI